MAASGDDMNPSADGDLSPPKKLHEIFEKYRDAGKDKNIPFIFKDMSGSMSPDHGIFEHEMLHESPHDIPFKKYPLTNKTGIFEKISESFNDKVLKIDANDYIPKKFDKNIDDLLGAPIGYQRRPRPKLELTPELRQILDEILADSHEYLDRDNSQASGERLAAACHSGIAAPTTAMKPLRFRTGGSTFAVAGAMW